MIHGSIALHVHSSAVVLWVQIIGCHAKILAMCEIISYVVRVHRVAGTGQRVYHDAHAVLRVIVDGVIVECLQHFPLETNAASGSVAVR